MQKNNPNANITTLDEILDKEYGKRGTRKREQWEEEFEKCKQAALLETSNP